MNKEKTMEVLRGMKFMQRKEEAKRRSLYEHERRGQAEGAGTDGVTSTSGKRRRSGPTIVFDTQFPTTSYALGRRSFATKERATTDASTLAPLTNDSEKTESTALRTHIDLADVDRARDLWNGEEGEGDSSSAADHGDATEDPTAPSKGDADKGRFYPDGAVRAPKLPKKLAKEVEEQERVARRRRHEEEEDGDDADLGLDNLW